MGDYLQALVRGSLHPKFDAGPIVAYDFESTNIPDFDGSVEPRFLTVYGKGIEFAERCDTFANVSERFAALWPALAHNTRLVAWNANRFDVRIVLEALVRHSALDWLVQPYVAKSGAIRGVKATLGKKSVWFYDGMAMLGLKCSLRKLCEVFAPD